MKLSLYTDDLFDAPTELVAVGVFADEPDRGLTFSHLNRRLDGALEQTCRDEDFKGKTGQTLVFNVPPGRTVRRILVFGLGERERYGPEAARQLAGTAARTAQRVGAHGVAIQLPVLEVPAPSNDVLASVQAMAEGARLGAYRFDRYRTRDTRESILDDVRVAFVAEDVQGTRGVDLREALRGGEAVAEGVIFARDLINEPPNALTPVEIAERAKKMAKAEELTVKILGPRDLERQGMALHLGVAQGSRQEPRLVHLTYEPSDKSKTETPILVMVGKGLTFDAGGLSLKTSEGMTEMKIDMGGAAAVLGAMKAIARLKPGITVHGLVGAAENMPDGNAIRPGDVLTSKRGLTVEILNTDAEGRLVLADALAYAQDLQPQPTHVVDLATLTGAALISLGRQRAAVYCDGPMREIVETAYQRSGELYWRMPLAPELREVLKSDIADIKNIGDRYGGSITAALFLGEFVAPELPWAHFDIAGPVWSTTESGHTPKGGTGYGVRTLLELVRVIQEGAAPPAPTEASRG